MSSRTTTYVIGYVLSVILTLIAFALVSEGALPSVALVGVVVGLAVIQLTIQLIFFLHIGSGHAAKWKILTFFFAVLTSVIVIGGSIWIMNNLNYNMLHLSPHQQDIYLKQHEGI
jgi:cytochrome o ubiquinol oxidase operon protein cyoD